MAARRPSAADDAPPFSVGPPPALGLLRHGTAEGAVSPHLDAERRLEDWGRREAKVVGEAAAQAGYRVLSCVSSPYPRAQETAVLFLGALEAAASPTTKGASIVPAVVEEDARLVPEASVRGAVDWILERWRLLGRGRDLPATGEAAWSLLLFVAHEPLLSAVATRLLGHRRASFERAELVVLAPAPDDDSGLARWQEVAKILPR